MLPFCGYNMADYFGHWLEIGKDATRRKLPQIFYVNWFRKDADGKFLWPGFGENSRVLKWVFERSTARPRPGDARSGWCPAEGASTPTGSTSAEDEMASCCDVDPDGWRDQLPQMQRALRPVRRPPAQAIGEQLAALEERVGNA